MKRGTVAALVLGCAGLGSAPALGATGPAPVDSGRMAATSVTVALAGGDTLDLDIRAADMSAGPELLIEVQRCNDNDGCQTLGDYMSPLAADALSIDPSSAVARLHTTLADRDLLVVWRPSDGATVSAGYVDGTGSSAEASNYVGDAAAATVQFDGNSCTGTGAVGQGLTASVQLAGDAAYSPVSALTLPDTTTLRCDG